MTGKSPDGEGLVELANADPEKGLRAAVEVLAGDPEPARRSEASRAMGIAHRNLGDLESARESLAQAFSAADEAGSERLASLALMSDALILSKTGLSHEALTQLDRAELGLAELERAELRFQRALVLNDVPDFVRARVDFTDALEVFRANGRVVWEGDALLGRAIALGSLGELDLAQQDCSLAAELFGAVDDQVGVGMAIHNAAWIAWLGGEAVKAVVQHDRATKVFEDAGFPTELIHADRCEALTSVGLYREAIDLAVVGAVAQDRAGNVLEAADQRLALARALMKVDQTADARREASSALDAFAGQGQRLQALRAEGVVAALDLLEGIDPVAVLERSARFAEEFRLAGNAEYEGEARLLVARAAIAAGRSEEANLALGQHARRLRPFSQEVERIALQARLHHDLGRSGLALRAARRGVRLVHTMQRSVDPVEVRATMSGHLSALRDVGMQVLTGAGRMRDALEFCEQANLAVHDGPRSPNPPRALIEHRALAKSIVEAEHELRDTTAMHRRRRELERLVRRERLAGTGIASATTPTLGDDVAVRRYGVVGRQLWAFEVETGRVKGTQLGPIEEVDEAVRELLFMVRRSLRRGDDEATESASRLDELLGLPGQSGSAGARARLLNLVLCEELPTFPIGLLPSMQSRSWVLALRSTSVAGGGAGGRGPVVGVCGPNLAHADSEIEAVARRHDGPVVSLPSEKASCENVLEAMNGASVVHLVAHSAVNPENPMFSTIDLADGPLYLHELESIARPPGTVILASCSSVRSVTVGVVTLGFTQALLSAGIGTVIGTALDIPDDTDTVTVMAGLHDGPVEVDPVAAVAAIVGDRSLSERQRLIARCLIPAVSQPLPRR